MPRFWLLAAAKTLVSANCRVRFRMHHDAGIAGILEAQEHDEKLVNVFEKHHQYFTAAKSSWHEACQNQGEARHLDAYDAFTRAVCELDEWQQRVYLVLLVHQSHAFK
ncbi:hypothetical protein BC831DRAFT_472668 [Entophlyctis helioformis]|nr:hypothetical protein BC831DRAFT_472668 [Entophlyctis helioformis]